ncbi:YjjG family noncanonical pyrimidine nucleotidase [Mobilitalea sibirica]|uniref:YjjG family noncanonical pyrimidine nucleotidase n=1 Tax=Mobilitalea sibirica TaxID=1462919 RepID=A0A8J7HDI2_9FIRM|nr:YjjG family noncanonical pyrimidine nucleotidase [Mobilitalea sibirica]MBH1940804.1 YjjG family noncanonical pyrimidine nucleotidase [Mobilitalea sibirica]
MNTYTTILLDADNTIFDFNACEDEALKQTFFKYGYAYNDKIKNLYEKINIDLWKQYELGIMDRETVIYTRFKVLFEQIGIKDDGIAFEDDYQELLGMQHFFIEDAPEVIQYLHNKYDLYIVTNGVTVTQYRRLRESGIDQYMKKIFVSEETGYQKPMKEYFDYCFERIESFDKDKTIIIGDSLSSDIKGGNNAGIATCWFNLKSQNNDIGVKVDYEINRLVDLYQIL